MIANGSRQRNWAQFWFQGMLVGLVMAGLDLAELFFLVQPSWLWQTDALVLVLLSLLIFAQFGGLVGLASGLLVGWLRRLPVFAVFRKRRPSGWRVRDAASLFGGLVGGGMVAMSGMMFYLEFGSGRLMRPGPLLVCSLAGILAVTALAGVGMFVRRTWVRGLVLAMGWILLYLLTDRFVAPFSRMGPVAFLHWGMIVGLVAMGQAGIMSLSQYGPGTHGKRRRAAKSDSGAAFVPISLHWIFSFWRGMLRWVRTNRALSVALTFLVLAGWWATTAWLLRVGNNETRLLLFERTALVFRPAWLMETTTFLGRPSLRNLDRILALCSDEPGAADGASTGQGAHAEVLGRTIRDRAGCPCGDQPVVRPSDSAFGHWPVRGVVVVMVDALRSDMLSTRRAGQSLTPNLLALADQSIFFDHAHSVVPATNAAVGGMLTGRYSLLYDGKFVARWSVLRVLRRAGIWNGAIVSHRHSGYLFAGLDMVDLSLDVVSLPKGANALTSAAVTSRALDVLRSLRKHQRFFLFVHYYDPHEHYVRNPMFRFGWSDRDRYEGEVAYTDFWIGKLLSALRRDGLWRDLAVMVVGDHGDELWEHRYLRHRVHLYEEVTRVPMILHLPGQVRKRHLSQPLSSLSVAATLLQLFGLPVENREVPSLMTLAGVSAGNGRGAASPGPKVPPLPPPDTFMVSADRKRWAVLSGSRKVIYNERTGVVESYDLMSDPGERRNLADDADVRTCRLLRRLRSWRRGLLTGRSIPSEGRR